MKIAAITDSPILCEETMYLHELKRRIEEKGHEYNIFVIPSTNKLKSLEATSGVFRVANVVRLCKTLSNFDVVHAQFTFPIGFGVAVLSALRLMNNPLVVHTHGYDVFSVPAINYGMRRKRIGRLSTEFTWRLSKRIIAVCQKAKEEIERTITPSEKVNVLYNGVDEVLFSKVSTSDSSLSKIRADSDIIFLSTASLVPVKNHTGLIKAFTNVVKNHPKLKIKLLLIGARPEYSDVSLADHVDIIYLGKIAHKSLPPYYSLADYFVLPSFSEGHPWSILEAMACELPVIASNVGGIPETLGDASLLLDPHSVDDITNKLTACVQMSADEKASIGKRNREHIMQSYTIGDHVNRLLSILESAS